MLTFAEFQNEGKYSGITLYHVTSYKNLIKILDSNKLVVGSTGAISFTRNRNLLRQATVGLGGVGVVLELDAGKLTNTYAVKPYKYHNLDVSVGDESEERVVSKNIDGLSKYLLRVKLYETYFPEPNTRDNMILCRVMGNDNHSIEFSVFIEFIKGKTPVPVTVA